MVPKETTDELIAKFEPSEKVDLTGQLMQLYAKNPALLGDQDSNLDKQLQRLLSYH